MNEVAQYDTTTQALALIKYGQVNPRLFDALFAYFGSLEKILSAKSSALEALPGMNKKVAKDIAKCAKSLPLAEAYLKALGEREIQAKTRFDRVYPNVLFELNDPPPLLYLRGALPDQDRKSVAVVGTGSASNEGIEMATRLARKFAENEVQVISTLRGGIGDAAHLGCRSAEGRSFAVLEAGFDSDLSRELMPVAIDIVQTGGVISEYQPDHEATAAGYKESNRLIVGLSQAVVATEFYKESSRTLDLLKFCSEIGKLLFVLIDPEFGAFSDDSAMEQALGYGAIPLKGYESVDDIIKSLV